MYNKTPLKTKAYISIVLSVVVICIVAFVGIRQNYKLKVRNTEAVHNLQTKRINRMSKKHWLKRRALRKRIRKIKKTKTK